MNVLEQYSMGRRQLRIAFVMISGWLLPSLAGSGEAEITAFKNFLESPPAVGKIVYERSYPGRPLPVSYWLFRWQPDAFLTRSSSSLDKIERPVQTGCSDEILGRFATNYWTVQPWAGGGWVRINWTDLPGVQDDTNRVNLTVNAILQRHCMPLNLGAPVDGIGVIRWEGDSFVYTNLQQALVVEAKLVTGKGKASAMEVSSRNTDPKRSSKYPATVKWLIEYHYEGGLTNGLPDEFTILHCQEMLPPRILHRYRIHELNLDTDQLPLTPHDTDGSALLASVRTTEARVTNSTTFIGTGTNWQPMLRADDPRISGPEVLGKFRPLYYFLGALVVVLPPLLVASWRMKKSREARRRGAFSL
jgi:hypothetical protein